MKKALLIFASLLCLNTSCTKDAAIKPVVVAQPVVVTPPPPVKIEDNVYPNPFHSSFTIQTNSTDSQTVQIFDMQGSIKLTLIINGTTAIADNSLTNGIYIVEITNRSGRINKKIIKE